jgi:hypothetical protein
MQGSMGARCTQATKGTAMNSKQDDPISPEAEQNEQFREAYERLLDEMREVSSDKLITINIDIPTSVTTVLGALPKIRPFRPQIVAELTLFDLVRFDKLQDFTHAVGYAHAIYMAACGPAEILPDLARQAVALRKQILFDTTALAKRGLIDGRRLTELKGPVGYNNLAFDLMALASLLRGSWNSILGKTPLQIEEVSQAASMATQLLDAVAQRDQAPESVTEATEIRHQAFTLFVGAYNQARRAIGYLRWDEGDVDEIAPSLYAHRRGSKRKKGNNASPTPDPSATPAQVPIDATQSAEFAREVQKTVEPVAVGLPGSSPLMH